MFSAGESRMTPASLDDSGYGATRCGLWQIVVAVRRFADDLHLRFGVEDHAEACAHEGLVVDEEDANHACPSTGS